MSNSTAQVLMKKGKRGAAAYILADCASGAPQHLGPLLDVLLNPSKAIDEWETIDWCRWLLAGGRTPDEFAAVVRSYDKHDKCGLVWIPRVVAYRCRTCGISPCMSICRECFHRGDHSTHDFNMFLSQAGGACDCGDNSVMKEDGFCSNHSKKCPRPGSAPAELMCVAEAVMPRLVLRLLQHFRENSFGPQANSDTYRIAVKECEGYVQMLMEINNMGDLMRSAMTKALINPQMYRNLVEPPFPDTEYGGYMRESNNMYEKAIDSFPAPDPPEEYRHLPALAPRLQHNTLLDEFIFWTFKYEFPQNVVCFLLNMLPDQDYKEHLTRTFVLHYARIPLVLEAAADPDTLSNRVVHMSVQLFSNEALALRCVQQLDLLHVMVLSLRLMMGKILVQNMLHDPNQNFHYVIDCTRRVMKEHCYWPLVSDFNNVLSHRSVALLFLQDDALVDMWFEFLSMLQGMNVNVREVGGHIEFEPSSYYAAFSCELEAAAYPMWSVLGHLTAEEHAPLAKRIINAALTYLNEWLDAVHFTTPSMNRREAMHASFHFPLHRYVAAFLCAAVRCMGVRCEDVLPPQPQLALLAAHPLRVQSLFYEILAGVWVRNGLQIKGQAMTYIQANFCNSMVDMDIYWLQICAAHLPADQFLDMSIDMFGVREWLSMSPLSPSQASEQDAMVEGLLTFLAILVSSRTNLGNDELTQSRLEVATLLAAGDKTHSQLLELMPERSGNAHTRNFEAVLKELSTYRPPPKGSENLEQGLFVPKPIVWEKYYDPLHVLRRAVHRRDFHASTERFTAYVREKQKKSGTTAGSSSGNGGSSGSGGEGSGNLWPPLRPAAAPPPGAGDPRAICASGVLHGALLAVLHRGVHRRGVGGAAGGGGPSAPPDHVLATAVFLLAVAADMAAERDKDHTRDMCVPLGSSVSPGAVCGVPLLSAFPRDAVCDNARAVVARVTPHADAADPAHARQDYPAHYHHDSDTEWEPPEPENTVQLGVSGPLSGPALAAAGPDTSTALAVAGPEGSALAVTGLEHAGTGSTALAVPAPRDLVRPDRREAGDAPRVRAIELSPASGSMDQLALEAVPMEDSDDAEFTLALPLDDADEAQLTLALPDAIDRMEPDNTPPPIEYAAPPGWSLRLLPPRAAPRTPALTHSSDHTEGEHDSQMQVHAQQDESIPVNESIISLLLKLHSQLSGRLDSFSLDEPVSATDETKDEPIGDGPHFIGQVLHKLARLDERCADAIRHVRHSLWPHQRERQAEQRARERREKEERSRRARERQQQVMREFQRRQQQFLSAMSSGLDGAAGPMDWDEEEAVPEYCCVICSTTAPTSAQDPVGLVVLLQSSSVLGHRRRLGCGVARLALSEPDRARLAAQADTSAAHHHYRLHDDLNHHFDQESWLVSVSVGWEGGVAVQSCGHHLHLRCLHAYLRSLAAPHRPHNLHVDRGEFLCPVCRQLANSVVPLSPPPPRARPVPGPCPLPTEPTNPAHQVEHMLDNEHPTPPPSRLSEAMGKEMEDMTATAGGKLKQNYGSSPAGIFTFVSSLVRTHLEPEPVVPLCPLPTELTDPAHQVQQMLDNEHPTPPPSRLSEAMGKAMEDMTATAGGKLKQRYGSSPAAIFTFVASLVRTNLECELVQRGGHLVTQPLAQPQPRYKPRNECIVPLTVVAAAHARVLQAASPGLGLASTWRALMPGSTSTAPAAPSAPPPPPAPLVSAPRARPVPLLLRDPLALLMQFILLAPANPPYIDIQHFTCIVRALYALTYYQIVCQFIAGASAEGRAALAAPCASPPAGPSAAPSLPPPPTLRSAARTLLAALAGSDLFTEDGPPAPTTSDDQPDLEQMETKLQSLLLPFVRVAALLRHHIYGQELPEIECAEQEFVRLAYYLELVTEGMEWSSWSAARALHAGAGAAARGWARELGGAAARGQLVVRRIVMSLHVQWEQPSLLSLPRDYDRLFSYYHERVCQQCGAVPKEASVCLLCGTLVCLKQPCCRQHQVAEAVQHAMECGGGTGIFLVVTSTYIIVIRGRRACLWGSLYLDDYDEEDRDLKRGKPLYLSQDRLELLQAQWLAHRFDHTKRTWVWHRDSL